MAQTKEFSILKWLVFPSLTLALAGVIAYFNVRVFGIEDGAPYVVIVGVLTAFSIAINKYISSSNIALARATFVFEIVLTLALAINAAYSFSVQREMSIAHQSESARSADLKTISNLKSRTAQRDATQMIATNSATAKSAQQIFADNERPLFWIMVGELLAYIVSAFTLLALSHLWQPKQGTQSPQGNPIEVNYRGERSYVYLPDGRKRVTQSTYSPDEVGMIVDADYEFPSELEDSSYSSGAKGRKSSLVSRHNKDNLSTRVETQEARPTQRTQATRVETPAAARVETRAKGLQKLRDHLKEISFYHPGYSFKADQKSDCVWIRMMKSEKGSERTVKSAKAKLTILDDVLTMNANDFRARLETFLKKRGFAI